MLWGLDCFVEKPTLLEMIKLNLHLLDCFLKRAIVTSVLIEDLAKIQNLPKSCTVIVLNSGGLTSFQEAFQTVVAQLVFLSPKPLNNI